MKAKCLCGQIEFDFTADKGVAMSCYCSLCRRAHGADYATQLISKKSSLKFIKGETLLTEYASSDNGIRGFCSCCGSRLTNYARAGSDYMSVALACVTTEHHIEPIANVQVASKAEWVSPNEQVDSFDVFPPDIHKYF